LIELIVSATLGVLLSGAILSLVLASQTLARSQPESLDVQQRGRVALQVLASELRDCGAGIEFGEAAGPLVRTFPPIAPSPDGGITMWTTTSRNAQGRPALAVALGVTSLALQDSSVCPTGQSACGFVSGTSAMAFTPSRCRTALRVAGVSGDTLQLAAPLAGCALDPDSAVAAGTVHTYRVDPVSRQLIRRDESSGYSAPVLDGVTSMSVALFADPAGASTVTGTSDAALMGVRRVRVILRFVASNPLLHVPDLDVVVDAAPRNLQGG
jgi:hypothetical protein